MPGTNQSTMAYDGVRARLRSGIRPVLPSGRGNLQRRMGTGRRGGNALRYSMGMSQNQVGEAAKKEDRDVDRTGNGSS